MAGDITIPDSINSQDFKTLKQNGVAVKVLLDLTHAKEAKPVHLDIELDFNNVKPDFASFLSKFKSTSTYTKLHMGAFKPEKKRYSGKYEAPNFSHSVIKDATNKRELEAALAAAKTGKVASKMLEVKYG